MKYFHKSKITIFNIVEPESVSDDDEVYIGDHSDLDIFKNKISPENSFKKDNNLHTNVDNIDSFNMLSRFDKNKKINSEENYLKRHYNYDSSDLIKYTNNSEDQGDPHDSSYYQKQVINGKFSFFGLFNNS